MEETKSPVVSKDGKSAVVYLHGPIGGVSGSVFQQQMIKCAQSGAKRITVVIASPGGDVDWGNVCLDTIHMVRSMGIEVWGVAHFAYSMAAMVLQACSHRVMSEGGVLMIHGPSSFMGGDLADHSIHAKVVTACNRRMATLLAAKTNSNFTYWNKLLTSERANFYQADKALEAGLVDEVAADTFPIVFE